MPWLSPSTPTACPLNRSVGHLFAKALPRGGCGGRLSKQAFLKEVLDEYKEGVRRECSRQKKEHVYFSWLGPSETHETQGCPD